MIIYGKNKQTKKRLNKELKGLIRRKLWWINGALALEKHLFKTCVGLNV